MLQTTQPSCQHRLETSLAANGANVYLSSAELAAVVASLGRLPTVAEYLEKVADIEPMSDEIYRYLNFNEMDEYRRA